MARGVQSGRAARIDDAVKKRIHLNGLRQKPLVIVRLVCCGTRTVRRTDITTLITEPRAFSVLIESLGIPKMVAI